MASRSPGRAIAKPKPEKKPGNFAHVTLPLGGRLPRPPSFGGTRPPIKPRPIPMSKRRRTM